MNAINQALQLLQSAGKASTSIPKDLTIKALTNPMSLYSAYKENPQDAMMGAVMGMTAPMKASKLKMVSDADRDIMGRFVEAIEEGKSKQNLGSIGKDAQLIADALGIKSTATNNTLANMFNEVIKTMDRRNISPIREK